MVRPMPRRTRQNVSSTTKERLTMLSKLLAVLFVVVIIGFAGSFIVLVSWDVPVKQIPVEKALDNSHFLEKNT